MATAPTTYQQLMKGKAKGKTLYEVRRGSSCKRGYGSGWRKLREMILENQPICQHPGCEAQAKEVDHIVPLARGGDNSEANLQGLCHSHHSMKTATEDGGFGR